jgi:Icc-related predicted phosphoesterase
MRILFSSDFHASRPAVGLFAEALAIGPFDAGIIAGDILDDFWVPDGITLVPGGDGIEKDPLSGIMAVEKDFKNILAAVGKPVFLIPGNHDPTSWEDQGSVINIHGKRVELGGYSIVGYRWTRLEKSEDEQRSDLKALEDLVDHRTVLVTHEPPFGKLDHTDYDSAHYGSKPIARFAWRTRPRYHLFGHIHGGFGIKWRAVNGSYPNARAFYDIDLEEGLARSIPAEIAMEEGAQVSS